MNFVRFFLALLQITVAFYTTSKNLLQLLNQVITGLHFGGQECMRKGAKKISAGASYFDSKQHYRMQVQVHAHGFCIICSYASKTFKIFPNPAATIARFYSISRDPNICLHSSTCCRTEIKGRFSLYQRCENYFPKLQSDTVFARVKAVLQCIVDHCLAVIGYLN